MRARALKKFVIEKLSDAAARNFQSKESKWKARHHFFISRKFTFAVARINFQ